MDQGRFDTLARSLASTKTRRGLLGSLAAIGSGLVGARSAGAQVNQAQCGNKVCQTDPAVCTNGCVCCVYANGNSRCRPPGTCDPGVVLCPPGQVLGSSGICAAPTTTTTTTTTAGPLTCGGTICLPGQDVCLEENGSCAQTCDGGGCPGSCVCSAPSVEGPTYCRPFPLICADLPQVCTSTGGCPTGSFCQETACGSGADNFRCIPICTTG